MSLQDGMSPEPLLVNKENKPAYISMLHSSLARLVIRIERQF
jgi:hypothetical protein